MGDHCNREYYWIARKQDLTKIRRRRRFSAILRAEVRRRARFNSFNLAQGHDGEQHSF
jgi:hypothetical protein